MATTYLSKSWTFKQVIGLLRILGKQVANEELSDDVLVDIINLAASELVLGLGQAVSNDYYAKVQLTSLSDITSDVYDASALAIENIVKIQDSDNGLYVECSPKELQNFSSIPQYKNKVGFCKIGESVYFAKGSSVSDYATNVDVYYQKPPSVAGLSDLDDTIDIRDAFINLVVDKSKIKVYEILGKNAPDALGNSVANNLQIIKDSQLKELDAAKNDFLNS